ncbi:MAG: hypothetical protein WC926_05390 [Candidatus Paceibacterota bacterium]|jgi:hypothetical protein
MTITRRIFKDGDDLKAMIGFLTTYQRGGDNRRWDDYRAKMPDDLIELWGTLLIECRRNGFVCPQAENGKLVWHQVTDNGHAQNGDKCTMCERPCTLRRDIDCGKMKHIRLLNKNNPEWKEPKTCWV